MAQTGYTPISIYYSATSTNVPTAGNLVAGELAINTADGKLFYKDSSGVVQTIATKASAALGNSTTGSGATVLQTSPTITTPVIDKITTSVANTSLGAGNASIMKNRIINGAMVIDQRNSGGSVTPTASAYTLDRWVANISQSSKFSVQQNAGSVTPPAGFTKYLGVTSLSAYSVGASDNFSIGQWIEGYNVADLNLGTANAKTVTVSAWVYSSLTGTFGGALQGYNGSTFRSYPFTYSIPVASTWTQISVTVAGDTTSFAYQTANNYGLFVDFSLGCGSTYSGTAGSWTAGQLFQATGSTSVVGTSGATFYITGVQLEVGSSATGFEYVNYQTSLANCQRYYEKFAAQIAPSAYVSVRTGSFYGYVGWQTPKRAAPTVTLNGTFTFAGSLGDINGVTPGAFDTQTVSNSRFYLNGGTYSPQSAYVYINTSLEISSEL